MRFRFCGDLDCPDWVLAEINILSRMTSVKMKLLCQQVVRSLLGEEIDYDKVKKLTADAKYELSDVKASVAALAFILRSSARHSVDEEAVSSELQQLGLPREHSQALCRTYADHFSQLGASLRSQSLRLSKLEDVQWRVNFVSSSSLLDRVEEPEVQLQLRVWDLTSGTCKVHQFSTTATQFHTLLADLKRASSLMEGL